MQCVDTHAVGYLENPMTQGPTQKTKSTNGWLLMIPRSCVRSPPALRFDTHTANYLAMMQGAHSKLAWEIVFWFLFGNIKISLNECETIRK